MDQEKCVEEAKEAKSFPLTMFPLKSMLGNFLLMYLMAVSMPFSVSRGRRDFGSAHVCDRRHHSHVLLNVALSQISVAFMNAFCSDLPVDLGSTVRTAGHHESYPTTLFLCFTLGITKVCWAHPAHCGENNWNLRRPTALTNFLLALPFCSKK